MEDSINKAAMFMKQVTQKKAENNIVPLDKKRLKEGTFHAFNNASTVNTLYFYEFIKFSTFRHINNGLMS